MDPFFHGEEVFRFLEDCDNTNSDCLVLLPREHGKTGMITQPRPAWWLAKNRFGRVVVGNANEQKAGKMARASANIITQNQLYQLAFPHVVVSGKWGEEGYYLNTSIDSSDFSYIERVDPSLGSYGVRGNITGAHPDLGMILDDLISDEMADSAEQVNRATRFFQEAVRCATPGSQIICCNTRWVYHDYCGKIISGELQTKKGQMKVLKVGITRTIDGKEIIVWPRATYIDQGENRVDVGFTADNVTSLRKTTGSRFSALYYNEPVMASDIKFNIPLIKTFAAENGLPFESGAVARVVVEVGAGQKSLLDSIKMVARQEDWKIPLHSVTASKIEKEKRILTTFQPLIKEGRLNIRKDLLLSDDNIGAEMRSFPKGHDDALDAATYAILSALNDSPKMEAPLIHIALDPAFSQQDYSDYSAIAVVCKYREEFYLLNVIKFKTDDTNVIIRMLKNVFTSYDTMASKDRSNQGSKKLLGFNSSGQSRRMGRRRGKRNLDTASFDIDLDHLHD